MLIIPPPPLRKRQPRPVVPASPVLIDGMFQDEDELLLTLTFDRAIALHSFDASTLLVNDPRSGASYRGMGTPTLPDPLTMQVGVTPAGGSSGTQILLTASAGSGIVAADAGLAWPGVSNFVLTIPPH